MRDGPCAARGRRRARRHARMAVAAAPPGSTRSSGSTGLPGASFGRTS